MTHYRAPGGPGVAFRHAALSGLSDLAVLRFPARQADRLGRDARGGAGADAPRAVGVDRRRRRHDHAAAPGARRATRRCAAAPFTPAGSKTGYRAENRPPRHEGGKPMTSRYSYGGDEHIFVECDEEMSLEAFFKTLSVTKAVRAAQHQGRHRDLPGQRLFPDQVRPRRDQARRSARGDQADRGRGGERSRQALDAHHRNSCALQRSLDARDLDALPRPPPGAGDDRHRIHRRDQPSRRRRGLRQSAFRRALVRLDGRLRRRPAVSLSDGRARAADPIAEISAAAHRYAEAHHRPRRLLRLHLFGARRRRLSDVRHHADADLRSQSTDQAICATSCACSIPATSSNGGRSSGAEYDAIVADVEAGQVRAENGERRLSRSTPSMPTSTEPTPS